MQAENLSTLKIHKLTQSQYDKELNAGRIDANALYLTPYEEIYATKEELETLKAELMALISTLTEVKSYLNI
jgi:hypothetical protein